MTDEDFMRIALKEAKIALQNNLLPVGAVVVKDGKVIGRGHKMESHSYHLDHAEIIALRETLSNNKKFKRSDNLTLYTTLEPCIMCYGTILHCPIKRMVYATVDEWGGATKIMKTKNIPARHIEKIPEIKGGVLEKESRKLMKKFLETTNNEFYKNKENPFFKSFKEIK